MNTEIIDYIKELSKREFFYINVVDTIFSAVIIVCAIISLRSGATTLLYTLMFASATVLLGMNSYKCFKRGFKNGWVFAFFGFVFLAVTIICVYSLIMGI